MALLLRGARPLVCLRGWTPVGRALSSSSGDGPEALAERWRAALLSGSRHAESDLPQLSQMLRTAIRLSGGRTPVPEELVQIFVDYYRGLASDKEPVLRLLASGLGVEGAEVEEAIGIWRAAAQPAAVSADPTLQLRAAARLADAAQPLHARLFGPIARQPGGTRFLVALRADVLAAVAARPAGSAPLRALAEALRRHLATAFGLGTLQLGRISWEASSAGLLERVAAAEAVHPVAGWRDLRRRLGPGRLCYAFFHAALPGSPLVTLHTALCRAVPDRLSQLLPPLPAAADAPPGLQAGSSGDAVEAAGGPGGAGGGAVEGGRAGGPTVAAFYSISNSEPGLAGIDLGQFLIQQVAELVRRQAPSVRTLVTLSPLPGFAAWLRVRLAAPPGGLAAQEPLLREGEAAALRAALAAAAAQPGSATEPAQHGGSPEALLARVLAGGAWTRDPRLEAALRPVLLRLAARYLLRERRRGLALDPVAAFHLRNGALVWRLCWRGDDSPAGLSSSHGLMVNYLYRLEAVAANNRQYVSQGRVAASEEVAALLRPAGTGQDGGARQG